MRLNRVMPTPSLVVAVAALVVGLSAPAAAHEVTRFAHKINGSSIAAHSIAGNRLKNNTITGKQVHESTLSTVPNAAKLGGKPASNFASTADATATGLLKIPPGGATHVLFTRYPLIWSGTCVVNGTSDTFTLSISAAENVDFTQGSTDLGTTVTSGHSLQIDSGGGNGTPVQGLTIYTVTGADGAQYMGEFSGQFKESVAPCAVSITAMG